MKQIKKLCPLPLLSNKESTVYCMGAKCQLYTENSHDSDCNCLAYPKYHYAYHPRGFQHPLFAAYGEGYTGKIVKRS